MTAPWSPARAALGTFVKLPAPEVVEVLAAKRPAAERETFRREFDLQLRLTALFEAAGVKMIAGSDCSGAA